MIRKSCIFYLIRVPKMAFILGKMGLFRPNPPLWAKNPWWCMVAIYRLAWRPRSKGTFYAKLGLNLVAERAICAKFALKRSFVRRNCQKRPFWPEFRLPFGQISSTVWVDFVYRLGRGELTVGQVVEPGLGHVSDHHRKNKTSHKHCFFLRELQIFLAFLSSLKNAGFFN